jgi:hypothetical protein
VALGSDPYVILGVPRDATDSEIAQARRRLSRDYHPDVNSAPDAAARFSEVQQAFELLSDPVARAEYDRAGARPGAAQMARERGSVTEAAPGIFVQPASVNFGLLELGEPGADAGIVISWTGASPGRIKSEPGNEWWTNLRAEMPDAGSVVFFLRAQAHAGAPNGPQHANFTVTLDEAVVAVPLTAEIRGVPLPPPPPDFSTTEPASHPARRGLAAVFFVIVVCIAAGVVWGISSRSAGGGGTPSATPPVKPIKVPEAPGAGIGVRPVFTLSPGASDEVAYLSEGLAGPPVLHGFELLLPVRPLPDPGAGLPSPCVTVTVPQSNAESDQAGAAGQVFTEFVAGTVAAAGVTELAYPVVLPGTYAVYPGCDPGPAGTPMTLGSVTTSNLGVAEGYPYAVPGNAMAVFAVRTSGAMTSITYGAIGGPAGSLEPSLIPPANDSCIDSDYTTSRQTYWQPVRALVSQQVTGQGEWFETGTLVFRGTPADRPGGNFFYDCAEDTPVGEPGLAIP